MALNLQQALLTRPASDGPNRPARPFRRGLADFITIHATGNPSSGADALMHARWMNTPASKGGPPYAWHFTVDQDRIVQTLPETEQGWHAGDGAKGPGNTTSIGIELCMPGGDIPEDTLQRAAELTALLRSRGHGRKGVVQHNHWSGKDCPQPIRRKGSWQPFLERVEEAQRMLTPTKPMTPTRKRVKYGAREAVAQVTVSGAVLGGVTALAGLPHESPMEWALAAIPVLIPIVTQVFNAIRDDRWS